MSPLAAALLAWGAITAALLARPSREFKPESYVTIVFCTAAILIVLTIVALFAPHA